MKQIKTLGQMTALAIAIGAGQAHAAALADIYKQALSNDPQLKAAEATSLSTQEGQVQSNLHIRSPQQVGQLG